jgi:hypothetical protein
METNNQLILRAQGIARTLTYNEEPEGAAKRVIAELCHRLDADPVSPSREVEALPFDDHVRNILGRPCFTLIGVANILRKSGHKIPPKAEEEQAACLHWMLNLYLKHGAKWVEVGEAEIKSALAPVQENAP